MISLPYDSQVEELAYHIHMPLDAIHPSGLCKKFNIAQHGHMTIGLSLRNDNKFALCASLFKMTATIYDKSFETNKRKND